MSTATQVQRQDEVAAGLLRSEPIGRAQGTLAWYASRVANLPDRVKKLCQTSCSTSYSQAPRARRRSSGRGAFVANEAAGGARDGGRAH
jgi:hypothetical protein